MKGVRIKAVFLFTNRPFFPRALSLSPFPPFSLPSYLSFFFLLYCAPAFFRAYVLPSFFLSFLTPREAQMRLALFTASVIPRHSIKCQIRLHLSLPPNLARQISQSALRDGTIVQISYKERIPGKRCEIDRQKAERKQAEAKTNKGPSFWRFLPIFCSVLSPTLLICA